MDRLTVSYGVFPSPAGPFLMAASEQGVCFVSLGQEEKRLERDMRDRLQRRTLRPDLGDDDRRVAQWIQPVQKYLAGQGHDLALPLDVEGTPFQQQVWQQLRQIPYGSQKTYGQVAAEMDRPQAARAVAGACAANPAALVIPCHRVVGANGGLGGYRWGVAVKAHLLAMEQGVSRRY